MQKIGRGASGARFPGLTKQMRMIIANQALKIAKDNYYKKYDELDAKMKQDYVAIGERVAEINGENAKDVRREMGRAACIDFAESSALPKAPKPPKSAFGKIASMLAIAGAAVAIPFTAGLSGLTLIGGTVALTSTVATGAVAAGAAGVAGIGLLGNVGNKSQAVEHNIKTQLTGSKSTDNFNYQETLTSEYNWETLECKTCIRARSCKKIKNPLFGDKYCKEWNAEINTCRTTQF
jgi:hypothetical protein